MNHNYNLILQEFNDKLMNTLDDLIATTTHFPEDSRQNKRLTNIIVNILDSVVQKDASPKFIIGCYIFIYVPVLITIVINVMLSLILLTNVIMSKF